MLLRRLLDSCVVPNCVSDPASILPENLRLPNPSRSMLPQRQSYFHAAHKVNIVKISASILTNCSEPRTLVLATIFCSPLDCSALMCPAPIHAASDSGVCPILVRPRTHPKHPALIAFLRARSYACYTNASYAFKVPTGGILRRASTTLKPFQSLTGCLFVRSATEDPDYTRPRIMPSFVNSLPSLPAGNSVSPSQLDSIKCSTRTIAR